MGSILIKLRFHRTQRHISVNRWTKHTDKDVQSSLDQCACGTNSVLSVFILLPCSVCSVCLFFPKKYWSCFYGPYTYIFFKTMNVDESKQII